MTLTSVSILLDIRHQAKYQAKYHQLGDYIFY